MAGAPQGYGAPGANPYGQSGFGGAPGGQPGEVALCFVCSKCGLPVVGQARSALALVLQATLMDRRAARLVNRATDSNRVSSLPAASLVRVAFCFV